MSFFTHKRDYMQSYTKHFSPKYLKFRYLNCIYTFKCDFPEASGVPSGIRKTLRFSAPLWIRSAIDRETPDTRSCRVTEVVLTSGRDKWIGRRSKHTTWHRILTEDSQVFKETPTISKPSICLKFLRVQNEKNSNILLLLYGNQLKTIQNSYNNIANCCPYVCS